MRYVIYGAGAIGGTIGASLFAAGHRVALIARGEHLTAVQRTGLRFQRTDAEGTYPIDAFGSPADVQITDSDVVVLAMKSQHAASAIESLANAAPSDVPVVCAQNGVESERLALRRFSRVYAMTVYLPADHLEPGVVRAHGAPMTGILDLGRFPQGTDEVAERIAADLEFAGFSSRTRAQPMRWKYAKLVRNLANVLDALAGPDARKSELTDLLRAEARAVFAAAAIETVPSEEVEERREGFVEVKPVGGEPRSGSSSWQSLARGSGSIETDYLNGEVVLLGRLHGVPTPVNAAVMHEARQAVSRGTLAGSLRVAELTERVLTAAKANPLS
jgi:2-dehydropantoate 2-reductase